MRVRDKAAWRWVLRVECDFADSTGRVYSAGAAGAAAGAVGLAAAGTWIRMLHWRQRTVLPRAAGGTDRIARQRRLGQIMRTEELDIGCSAESVYSCYRAVGMAT